MRVQTRLALYVPLRKPSEVAEGMSPHVYKGIEGAIIVPGCQSSLSHVA